MDIEEIESMKAKVVTAGGAVIFMERTDAVSDAEWFKVLATIHLADEVTAAARRVVRNWSRRGLAESVQRLEIALDEVRHYAKEVSR